MPISSAHRTISFDRLNAVAEIVIKYTRNDRVELQTLKTFFCIAAASEPIPMQTIEKHLGMAQSSVSRNVARLGIGESIERPGPGLIHSYEDPRHRRRKLVKLTPLGTRLAEEIDRMLRELGEN